ncbi:hypothetical protein T484DRAFT_2290422 [Baffinella frigidus]|nr:hypothetical protein T484DRAFT_2290422 [Cryptophyta sp. CCMP2293]
MRVRLTLATASAATLSILVAPSSSLLPAGIDVAWSAVPVEITYFLPSPVLVSALPRSLLFDRAASVTVVVKYLRQVGYPDEVTAFIAGVAVPTAGITIDYSEQFLASITLATKRLPAPGIYPLVILTGSGALATSLTTSLTFRDASVTVTCASGCVSDSVAGKRASFSFSAEMDWSNFTVQVGGVVVPVSAVKATVAGKKFLVTVNSLPSLGTVQAASAVVITSGRADVSVVVTSQADDSMTAETSIYYVTAPEVASAQVDATGCSVVVKLDQATNKAGMTGAWVACDAILRTIPSGGSQPVPFRFGNASKCVWTTNMEITATTSNGASLVPGDRVVITPSAASLLRSADGVSRTHAQDASTAATGRTLLISAAPPVPVVSVVGPQVCFSHYTT